MSETRRALVLLDSIAHVDAGCAGQVVVSGSHGGTSAAGFVLAQERPPLACFFNDGAASGVITHLNAAAKAAGLAEGMRVADAVAALGASPS